MIVAAGWGVVAQAQGIEVIEDRGQRVDPEARTVLEFRADDDVEVHRVLSRTTVSGYNVSGYGETTERLCAAPCRLEVPDGHYLLRVDDNLVFGKLLKVDAAGEPLAWEVRRAHPVRGALGLLVLTAGISGLTVGGTMLALDESGWQPVVGWSAGATIGGTYLMVASTAKARAVRP